MNRNVVKLFLNKLPKSAKKSCQFHYSPVACAKLIRTIEQNGVREILLNDQKTRNALSCDMMNELHQSITKNLNDINLRVIILSTESSFLEIPTADCKSDLIFSSGHNLKELTEDKGSDSHKKLFAKLTEIIMTIRQAPVPVIAKVDGQVVGAGCQLAASCDILVCSERTSFSLAATDFGLFASTPAVAISRVMTRMKSAHLLLSGLSMSATEANVAGLVSCVTPTDKLDEEVNKICCSILRKSRAVIKLGKEFYYKQLEMNIEDAYKEAENVMVQNLATQDGKEGVQSFIEKRDPIWKNS